MLSCDRCKLPITGGPYKFEEMDLCANCYPYMFHLYFPGKPTPPTISPAPSRPPNEAPLTDNRPPVRSNASPSIRKSKPVIKESGEISKKMLALLVILILLLSTSVVFSYYAYTTWKAPYEYDQQAILVLSTSLSNEQNSVDNAVSAALQYRSIDANLIAQNGALNQSLSNENQQIISMQTSVSALYSQNAALQSSISQIEAPTQTITRTQFGGQNSFITWNVPQSAAAGYFLEGSVPDTFDYHDTFTYSVPVDVYYFSDTQFVQWYNAGSSTANVTGNFISYLGTKNQSDTFTLSEGCAGYVGIYYFPTAGTIYPNVSVTYNPASRATGVCAQN